MFIESRLAPIPIHARYVCSSQYLKELFISCFLSLSIFPPVSPLESGCKGKACFSFSKLFKLFFQTFFPVPPLTSFPRALSLESGCKDKAFLSFPPNLFRSFFKLFFLAPPFKGSRRERSSSTSPERRHHVNSPSPRLASLVPF